ncbi:MAG: FIST C-terminal domain-containing protein [Deltaproteobacteria bacterium]|nr:FIST C-terminal domain-containing protein [Deltaproteobacteria bacterium]
MMASLRVFTLHTDDVDTEGALEDLLAQAEAQLGDRIPRAGLLFAAIDFDHDLLVGGLVARWPQIQLIGCTTDGEASSAGGFQEDSAVLTLFVSEHIHFAAGVGAGVGADPLSAAREAVAQAAPLLPSAPALCFTTPDGLTTNGSALVAGLGSLLGPIPIVGGTAADQWRFRQTRQFCGGEVYSDAVPVLLVSGALRVAVGVASGWTPVGRTAIVTRAVGNTVYEIDNRPAAAFYEHYLGPQIKPSAEYPLAILDRDGVPLYLRAAMSYDTESGVVHFAGTVPEGARVRLTEISREAIVNACRTSVDTALERFGSATPAAVLLFSCAARKQLLGTRTAEECEVVASRVPPGVPFAGFYANGEIGPTGAGGLTQFHNETLVSVVLGCSAGAAGERR